MGANNSSLADCVLDGDVPALKAALRVPEAADALAVEQAVHTAVAMDVRSPQQLQQLQIALELLLLARPEAWGSRTSGSSAFAADDGLNNADWTASHRACVTGNLSFVAFVRQQQKRPAEDAGTVRDAFGLLPVDLVPPELLRTREEVARELVAAAGDGKTLTARERRSAAIHWLRESKAAFETRQVLQQLLEARERQAAAERARRERSDSDRSVEMVSKAEEDAPEQAMYAPPGAFFVAFEPSQERFPFGPSDYGVKSDGQVFMGHVHDRDAPLRVRFRVPRAEIFLQGYFQLIWRAPGEPRSEEPHYEPQVLRLRDELLRRMDQNPPLDPEQLMAASPEASVAERRLVDDESDDESGSEVSGWFPISVSHLPQGSVAHVLFVSCDRNLLHRSIVLSTEGVIIETPPMDGDYDSSDDEYSDEEEEVIANEEEAGEYTFLVGGEEFRHPSPELDGKEFNDVAELEAFVQSVCAARKKQRELVADDGDKQHDERPGEPTQVSEDGHDPHDTSEGDGEQSPAAA